MSADTPLPKADSLPTPEWELAADRHVAECAACKHWCGWCDPLHCDYGPQPRTIDLRAHVADVGVGHGKPECYPEFVSSRVPTALDFPDCSRCQSWRDAGASWPRPCAEHYGGEARAEQPLPTEADDAE